MDCLVCKENSGTLINCGHYYCDPCLLKESKTALCQDNKSFLKCKDCKSLICKDYIYKAFGGIEKFLEYQNNQEPFDCPLCLRELKLENASFIDEFHIFCNDCIKNYLVYKIEYAEFDEKGISCIACENIIKDFVLQEFLTSELWEKYQQIIKDCQNINKVEKSVKKWCLFCNNCCIVDPKNSEFFCLNCQAIFCSRCKNLSHETRDCEEVDIEEDAKKAEKIEENLKEDLKFLEKTSIKCPECGNAVALEKGCKFVRCLWISCKVYFCVLCYKVLSVRFM